MVFYHILKTGEILETESLVLEGTDIWKSSVYCNFRNLATAKTVAVQPDEHIMSQRPIGQRTTGAITQIAKMAAIKDGAQYHDKGQWFGRESTFRTQD